MRPALGANHARLLASVDCAAGAESFFRRRRTTRREMTAAKTTNRLASFTRKRRPLPAFPEHFYLAKRVIECRES